LLIVNFAFYIAEDWNRAMHSLREGASFFKWTSEFAAIEMNVSAWGDETQTEPLEPT